jgi:hypothetical protein
MGAQCGRLCCRPCKKQITIKQRIQNIYQMAPIQITELYCKNKSSKICEYLKDRRSHIPKCVQEFKSIISSISAEFSAENERVCLLTLYSLRSFSEHFMEFLPLTYNFIYQLMQKAYFSSMKIAVYDTLRMMSQSYPEEDMNDLEDIMNELIKYLSDPKNVTKHEIKLLSSILIPLHEKIAGNNGFDWKKLLTLILDRVISGEDFEEELALLKRFSKILLEIKTISEVFLGFVIKYIDSNNAWHKNSTFIIKAVLEGNKEYFLEKASSFFKEIVEFVQVNKKKNAVSVVECLMLIIDHAETINTWHFSQLFEEMIVKIVDSSNTLGTELLKLWATKADFPSFARFYKDFVFKEKINSTIKTIVSICKTRMQQEFKKIRSGTQYLQPLVEMIYEILTEIKSRQSAFMLKVLFI